MKGKKNGNVDKTNKRGTNPELAGGAERGLSQGSSHQKPISSDRFCKELARGFISSFDRAFSLNRIPIKRRLK